MATATKPALTDNERHARRDDEKKSLATNRKLLHEKKQHGREIAVNKQKIETLKDDAARAVALGRPTEPFDEQRRKLEDRNIHLRRRLAELSRVDSEIAAAEGRLRGALVNPQFQAELFVARRALFWADKRRDDAKKEMREAKRRLTTLSPEAERGNRAERDIIHAEHEAAFAAAELAAAERLHSEAADEVERVKRIIIDE